MSANTDCVRLLTVLYLHNYWDSWNYKLSCLCENVIDAGMIRQTNNCIFNWFYSNFFVRKRHSLYYM